LEGDDVCNNQLNYDGCKGLYCEEKARKKDNIGLTLERSYYFVNSLRTKNNGTVSLGNLITRYVDQMEK
jgi:hypothetical protein